MLPLDLNSIKVVLIDTRLKDCRRNWLLRNRNKREEVGLLLNQYCLMCYVPFKITLWFLEGPNCTLESRVTTMTYSKGYVMYKVAPAKVQFCCTLSLTLYSPIPESYQWTL